MNNLDKDRYLPFFINFSARTTANQTQVTARINFSKESLIRSPAMLVAMSKKMEHYFVISFLEHNYVQAG